MNGDDQKPAGFPPPSEKPKAPPPPPPEISIRTMKSDLESLKQTGGISPTPKTFVPPELEKVMQEEKPKAPPAPAAPTPPPPPPARPTPPPAPSPAAPLPPRAPMAEKMPPPKITPSEFEKPTKEEMGKTEKKSPIIEEESESRFNLRKLLVWSGAAVIVIGVGLIGYFYIFPLLFPAQVTPPPPAVTTPTQPEPTPEETSPEPEAPEFREHESLLSNPAATSTAQLDSVNLTSLLAALQTEAQTSRPSGSLVELILSGENGQISASEALASWLPDRAETLQNVFEDDFTTALYYDSDGVWPVYIFNLSLDSSPVEAQSATLTLESSGALTNLFVNPPGDPNAAGFRAGQANGLSTRYLTYSQRGAALNLAWSGDRFIISTSYNGLRQALNNIR